MKKHNSCNHTHDKASAISPTNLNSDDKSKHLPENLIETIFNVSGMDCSDEVGAIQTILNRHKEIFEVHANLMAGSVTIHHLPTISAVTLRTEIESTGVRVEANNSNDDSALPLRPKILVLCSGLFLIAGFGFEFLLNQATMSFIMYVSAILTGGVLIFPKALRSLRYFRLDINVLMSVAVTGAFLIKEYSEGATVVFLFAFSELLEAYSVTRARKAIREVLDISPQLAFLVLPDGNTKEVLVSEVKIGDRVLVKSGVRIPMDGIVRQGSSMVNQAPLTGESIPQQKAVNDQVFAGTINESGSLEIEVLKLFQDSKASQIIKMIEDAQREKAPTQRFVDTFAKYYTPLVFGASLLVLLVPPVFFGGLWDIWIYRSLVLLVIACPCALVISTPVSIVSGLAALARRGVLIKGGIYLEILGKIRAIAVDKTGTITVGTPIVQGVYALNNESEELIIQIAASLESFSSHPLARAVIDFAKEKQIQIKKAVEFNTVVGYGVEAKIDGHQYFLGNHRFAHDFGVCGVELEKLLEGLEEKALSVIVVGHKPHGDCQGEVLGVISVGDKIRENAAIAIDKIRKSGIEKIIMLSGDNQKTAQVIASMASISEVSGNLLPEDKAREMKRLVQEYGVVAMIGDGINDGPALAEASLGIAMGVAGTDTALETADMVLMKDDLEEVAMAIVQGRRVMSVVKFNIAFALAIKGIFLILALFGATNLWLAVAADTGTSLLVIANALRLLRI